MTPAETAMGALLGAISGHLPYRGPGPEQDVRLACAAVIARGCAPAALAEFTALLAAQAPGSTSWGAACQSCGNTTGLDAVHFAAAYGLAERTQFYCHDTTACHHRRRTHTTAISGIAS